MPSIFYQNLIKQFRIAHQSILGAIDQVQLYSRQYHLAKPKIRDLHDMLLEHLSRQNNDFFAPLKDGYASNREASKMLEFLIFDTKEMKIQFLTFFDLHSGEPGDKHFRKFSKDFAEFAKIIIVRIDLEEAYLLPLMEKM